jgi:hypothetical protein
MRNADRLSAIALARAAQFVVVCVLAAGARAEGELDLTGTWLLDQSLSDNPTKVLRDASSTRGGDGLGKRIARSVSVFGIPVGSLPLPSGGGDEEEESEADDPPENALQPISRIRILQDAHATELEYDGSTTVAYRHGIREEREDRSIVASWKNGALEVEHRLADGSKISESYVLNSAAEQLEWTVRFKPNKGDAAEIRRVFYHER